MPASAPPSSRPGRGVLLAALGLLLALPGAQAARVVEAAPQGEAAQVAQFRLRFDASVASLGDARQPEPAHVSCEPAAAGAGSGRWEDDRTWRFDFRQALPPGTRCTARMRPQWQPVGGPYSGPAEFRFSTGGPAVTRVRPWPGSPIEEDQHFILELTGPATEASIQAHAGCEIEGLGERVPVRLVGGSPREALLQAQRLTRQADRVVVLACQRPLPTAGKVRLVWGKGIASQAQPALRTSEEQRFNWPVREAFSAEFSCERERAQAPCLPLRPVTLRFSAPVARAVAEQVRLEPREGTPLAPRFAPEDTATEVSVLTFPAPLPENAALTLRLPAAVRDTTGRPLANAGSFPLALRTGGAPPIAKFASAPFGVVELHGDPQTGPVLPVTLRHVQADLRAQAPTGQVRVLSLQDDAQILQWFRKVQRHHESQLTARELGLPAAQWKQTVEETDERGRKVRRQVERYVATREVSLLRGQEQARRLTLPALEGGDPRPFEVVGIPLPGPGYHVVEIESARLGAALLDKPEPMFVRSGVLVTNLGVHAKIGREDALVWVTTLDRGRAVADAEVAVSDCQGRRLWAGRTDARGVARIAQALAAPLPQGPGGARCPGGEGGGEVLFVSARKADAAGTVDTAFVFTDWDRGIEAWRFNVPVSREPQAGLSVHTVFDRTLLRAGETVSMKHFVRVRTGRGLALAEPARLPDRMRIVHEGSGDTYTLPLEWRGARSAVQAWQIPPAARLGSYQVTLERTGAKPGERSQWTSGEFRVEEFRVPLVDARLAGPKNAPVAPKELALEAQLNYLNGGGVARAPLRLTALLRPRSLSFPGYEDFSFEPPAAAGAGPREERPEEPGEEGEGRPGRLVADRLALTTSREGAARAVLRELPKIERASEIVAELGFTDPNGEAQTVTATVPLWPAGVVVGIQASSWASTRGAASFTVVALDVSGQPVRGHKLEVRGQRTLLHSTRKRMVGGFYAWDHRSEVQELGTLCSGTSDEQGRLRCTAKLETAGQVQLVASARDALGHRAEAAASVWVTGQGELWFAQDNDDRIDVLPQQRRVEPGQTARLQVRMPFREATALVTVEREGVLDARVVTLRGSDPTIELPVDRSWGPNVYVSVLALRGRIREVPWYSFFSWGWRQPLEWARSFWHEGREYRPPTALVDLARPSFKLGVAELQVGLQAHALQVQVTPEQPRYGVRDKARVKVRVTQGGEPVAGAEVAFAAVDEGLLALRDNDSWDLLRAMLQRRAWGVQTSTGQGEIIGRRHYGRKAVAAGGGGGRGGTRELFDTLLLWAPRVSLDARGEAVVEVPLNDSLTSFRLVAVADAGAQTFGTGSASIAVTQDLQLLAGLPPLVREGDRFRALLTLRNTTARAMEVRATLRGTLVRGAPGSSAAAPGLARAPLAFAPQLVKVAAGAAAEVTWDVEVPAQADSIAWEAAALELRAEGGAGAAVASGASGPATPAAAQDRLRVTQLVAPAVPVRVVQATLQQLDGSATLPVAAPADALRLGASGPVRGGLAVSFAPSLAGTLPGVRRFFEAYPYSCLEQQASRAIGLRDAARWAALMRTLPTYLDRDGLAAYFPLGAEDGARGSDRLTAYLLAAADEAGLTVPAAERQRMLDGLAGFVEGRLERRTWAPRADLEVRKLAALEALARHGRAQPRMLGSISLTPRQWPTSAVIDWLGLLRRLEGIPERAARLQEAQQVLRSRLAWSGTVLRFSTEDTDAWWWLMDGADVNAARLLLAVLEEPAWRDDVPRLVAGTLGRQRQGAWHTTTANVWGTLALDRFAATFERVRVAGRTSVGVAAGAQAPAPAKAVGQATPQATAQALDWARTPAGGALQLPWPAAAGTLKATHEGAGRPWMTVQALAALPPAGPVRAGYSVVRTLVPVERQQEGRWSRGDIVRVRVEFEAAADMSWVVLSDPVPGGATILGSGLGRDSALATRGERAAGDAWVAFDERSFEAFRRYFEFLPRGRHVVEYTVRLNNPGRFQLPPTRVEAMYAPENFGELPNAALEVAP